MGAFSVGRYVYLAGGEYRRLTGRTYWKMTRAAMYSVDEDKYHLLPDLNQKRQYEPPLFAIDNTLYALGGVALRPRYVLWYHGGMAHL